MPDATRRLRAMNTAASGWTRRHTSGIHLAALAAGIVLAAVVVVGTPRADGGLAALSGLLVTVSLVRLLDRRLSPPDWRFGALLAGATVASVVLWIGFDWDALHAPAVILMFSVFGLEPRSPSSPRWRHQASMQERLAKQREREARIRREYPEEFQPAPWERAD